MGQCGGKLQTTTFLKSDETASVVHDAENDEKHSQTPLDDADTPIECNTNTREESLLSVRFERTLFCGDITYQYEVSCPVAGIESWTTRLTVEDLTAFFVQTFSKWDGCHDAEVPDQCGKVMRPETFTECLQKVLDVPAMLQSEDPFFSEPTADLLSIPYGVRPVIQYDAEQFQSSQTLDVEAALGDHFEDKCLYLSHQTVTYSPKDLERDAGFAPKLSAFYPTATVSCTSYWLRVLPQKMDLLVTFSCGTFYVVMSECTAVVAAALMESVSTLDADCAWTIADYLPKRLFLNQSDQRCNARIVYKHSEEDSGDHVDSLRGAGVMTAVSGDISKQCPDAVSMEQLQSLCQHIQQQHDSVMEREESLSEFLELATDSCPESVDELEFVPLQKLSSDESTDSVLSISLESRDVAGSRNVNALPFFALGADRIVKD